MYQEKPIITQFSETTKFYSSQIEVIYSSICSRSNKSISCTFCHLTQDDFKVWEGEVSGKGKDRHLFLFKDKLMLTKKVKPKNRNDPITYEFKQLIDVSAYK